MSARIPASTYRIQLGGAMTFRGVSALLPYLRQLGVDACYLSPALKATPGTVNVVSSGTGVHTLVLLVAQEKAGQRDLGSPGVRDRITGYSPTLIDQLRLIGDLFAQQLARVIRIHHRHLPKDKWGAIGDVEEDGPDIGGLAA